MCTHYIEHELVFIVGGEVVRIFAFNWVYGPAYFVKVVLVDEDKKHGCEEERHVHQGVH